MAAGGNFSRTLEGGHETFYDFTCSLCEEENKHVEAVKYCEECFVFLCGSCLKEKHNIFPLHKRHQLVEQSQFDTMNKSVLVSFPTKRCPKHPGELINIFCGHHDVVCCSVCKALEHSSCVKTKHLPDAAKGVKESKEFHNLESDIITFVSDVDKVLNDLNADISRIAKEKKSVRETIADFRKKVNKYFDDVERNSLAELDQREQTIVDRIDKDKKYLENTKSKAKEMLKKNEQFKGDNECDLFVEVKSGLQFVNDEMKKIRAITEADVKPSIQFEVNKNIEEYIRSLKLFGSFSSTSVMATPPQTYKIQKCEEFDIDETSDTDTCYIYSICQLTDDTFLITDGTNEKLKRLDQSLKLMDSVRLSGCPHSVCAAGPGKAAVSLLKDKKIQLVSVGKELTLTRSFDVVNDCRGIVLVGDEFFVCCGDYGDSSSYSIKAYNNGGQLQRTIPFDQKSSEADYIAISDDGQHLLVTSWDTDVITMRDLTGNVVDTFSHKDLNVSTGICTDGRGQVFVCGFNSNTVVQLSPKHQKIDVILKEKDGIIRPQGVYYDRKQSRLLVSCYNKNKLFSFKLK